MKKTLFSIVVTLSFLVLLTEESLSTPSSERSRKAIAAVTPALTKDLEKMNLQFGSEIFIRVFKKERELEMWVKKDEAFVLFRTYPIAAMSGKLGPKLKNGDKQAPEGFYYVPASGMNPTSRFHLSFNLGYPNAYDKAYRRTGHALMVHGDQVSIGCYAMTDKKIEEIYALADAALQGGQPFFRVHCFPFRMTPGNMAAHKNTPWMPFWTNLKLGYEAFEKTKLPPDVSVKRMRYVFN